MGCTGGAIEPGVQLGSSRAVGPSSRYCGWEAVRREANRPTTLLFGRLAAGVGRSGGFARRERQAVDQRRAVCRPDQEQLGERSPRQDTPETVPQPAPPCETHSLRLVAPQRVRGLAVPRRLRARFGPPCQGRARRAIGPRPSRTPSRCTWASEPGWPGSERSGHRAVSHVWITQH